MIVYCNPIFSQDIWDKNIYAVKYMSGLVYYFQDYNFGDGVSEIVYSAVCGDSTFLISHGVGMSYSRRHKTIGLLFVLDYEMIQSLKGEELLLYLSEKVIVETRKIMEIKIKNFDLLAYIKALEKYFSEAIILIRDGKDPEEGKVLNADTQLALAKKWSKL